MYDRSIEKPEAEKTREIYVSEELYRDIEVIAKSKGLSVSDYVNVLVAGRVNAERPEASQEEHPQATAE